jgi:hypothetical protein
MRSTAWPMSSACELIRNAGRTRRDLRPARAPERCRQGLTGRRREDFEKREKQGRKARFSAEPSGAQTRASGQSAALRMTTSGGWLGSIAQAAKAVTSDKWRVTRELIHNAGQSHERIAASRGARGKNLGEDRQVGGAQPCYSYLRETMGSTFVARRAGM